MRSRSDADMSPHQALEAYSSLARMTDLEMACIATPLRPCARSTLNTYRVCAHELMMPHTCSDADRPFVHVTQRTVSDVTRAVTGIFGGAAISAWRRLFLSTTIISLVLPLFSIGLLARAHVTTFLISMDLKSALLAGMSR